MAIFELNEKTENKIYKPKMFTVIMHNDDYTTMDFVIDVLINIFNKSQIEATTIMMDIHSKGKGIAGVYTYDIAVTKKIQTDRLSGKNDFPLKLSLDEAIE